MAETDGPAKKSAKPRKHSKTLRKRRVGAELRKHRDATGMNREEVGEKLDCSGSKITRIENGDVGVRREFLSVLLDLYGVTDEDVRADLLALSKRSREPNWWQQYNELPSKYLTLIELESVAHSIRWVEPLMIPGLLQTERYARAIIEATAPDGMTPEEIDRQVNVRMTRQPVILDNDDPPELWVLLDEAALRRQVGGPEVMREQYEHLVSLARKRKVRLQVIPFDHGGHEAMTGGFTILRFEPPDPDVVYVDSIAGNLYLDQPADIERCSLVFNHLCASAAPVNKSIKLIAELARNPG